MTISEMIMEYLTQSEVENRDGVLYDKPIYFSTDCLRNKEVIQLMDVINEKLDNFVVFDNGRGRSFFIWEFKLDDIDGFIEYHKTKYHGDYLYAYKVNGVETIVKPLVNKPTKRNNFTLISPVID